MALPLAVWTAGVTLVEVRVPATPALGLSIEGIGLLALAVALAAVLRRAGRIEPGEIAASVACVVALAVLLFGLPSWWSVPLFPEDAGWPASTALWSGLTMVAVGLVFLTSADPYRPSWVRMQLSRRPHSPLRHR